MNAAGGIAAAALVGAAAGSVLGLLVGKKREDLRFAVVGAVGGALLGSVAALTAQNLGAAVGGAIGGAEVSALTIAPAILAAEKRPAQQKV